MPGLSRWGAVAFIVVLVVIILVFGEIGEYDGK